MEAIEIVEGLAGFAKRGAGTDAERRAAAWLAFEFSRDGADATIETFWCRPNWAMTHALHAALAVAGSLVSLLSPVAAISILGVTLASIVTDSLTGRSPARRLTRERASQNVTWIPSTSDDQERIHLIVTANYDAPRSGVAYRSWLRRPATLVRAALNGTTPGWLGWLAIATGWLFAIAVLRAEGHTSHTIGALQLAPTTGLLIALALLLDIATSGWSPRASESATGPAVAAALTAALETAPPRNLDVELVLTGAGDHDQIGLRQYLQSRRGLRSRENTVVLGIAPCAAGPPHWWFSDGPLIPLRYAKPLRELAQQVATQEPHLQASAHRGRGTTPALPAREAGIPAITIGCLNQAPADSHALGGALQFGLLLVDAIDGAVGDLESDAAATRV